MKHARVINIIGSRYFLGLFFLWASAPTAVMAQSLDSLEKVLATKKHTEAERIEIYTTLSDRYANSDLPKSLDYSNRGLQLALAQKNRKAEAILYKNKSVALLNMGNYDSTAYCLEKAIDISATIADAELEGKLLNLYGILHTYKNEYDQAMDYFKRAALVLEKVKDHFELSIAYAKMGLIYRMLSNDDLALTYYEKAKKTAIESANKACLAEVYIGEMAIYKNQDLRLEEVVKPGKMAIEIYRELDSKFGEASTLATLANTYSYYDDYQTALPMAQQALHIAEEVGLTNLAVSCATILSTIHYYLHNYEQCIRLAKKALQLDSTDINMTKHSYAHLALSYGQLGQIDSMEQYVNTYYSTVQDYYTDNFKASLSEMEVKYETEKKELKIGALEKQRQLYLWLGVAGVALLLTALAVGFMRYRLVASKRKLAEGEACRLEQENKLVAVQATLDGEAAERSRLDRDLHDGLGSMLSAVKINLPDVKGDVVLEEADVSRFKKAIGMLDDSIQELRRVAHHMMPESLLRYGLKVSLSDFCAAIPIAHFHYFGTEFRLAEKMEIMIYRCIHELVNNALKHAHATEINVQLIQEDNRLSFTVQDDGVGFDTNSGKQGMGLQNIRQRVNAFDGKMEISSSEKGTEVHIELTFENRINHD